MALNLLGRLGIVILACALAAAVAGALFLVFIPTYAAIGTGSSATVGAPSEMWTSAETLAEVNGRWVFGLLLIPLALAAAPLLGRSLEVRRVLSWTAGIVLLVFSILTGFSIGMLFMPAALLVLLAALLFTFDGSEGGSDRGR